MRKYKKLALVLLVIVAVSLAVYAVWYASSGTVKGSLKSFEPQTMMPKGNRFEPESFKPATNGFTPETFKPTTNGFEPETFKPTTNGFEPVSF